MARVEIYALGRFSVLVAGHALRFSRKVQRRPLELLKLLVALEGRDPDERALSDMLWPHVDGDSAHHCFATTLHRLRRLLGANEAIALRGGRVSLDERHCWVDAWDFDLVMDEIDAVGTDGEAGVDRLLELHLRASQLYHGPFLAGDDGHACYPRLRERLARRFRRHLLSLGERYAAQGRCEDALALFEEGVDVDELAEELYHGQILCNAVLGRRTEALNNYKRYCEVLRAEYGLAPAPRTEALSSAVKAGDTALLAEAWRRFAAGSHPFSSDSSLA